MLTQALGVPVDAAADSNARLRAFLQSGAQLAFAFRYAWQRLQAEAWEPTDAALTAVFENATGRRTGVQRALTRWREYGRFRALDVDLRGLPRSDMRRAAWLNVDRFSTVWVPAWPTSDLHLSTPEFREVATFYFGLPSPACASRVGEGIANLRQVLDAHGVRRPGRCAPPGGRGRVAYAT